MEIKIDRELLINTFKEIVNIPSPTSYYDEIQPYFEKRAAQYGLNVTYDRQRTAYITIDGQDHSKTVCLSSHSDTLGLMVRHILDDGQILFRRLGGINFSNIEGEGVTIITRDGRKYRGMIICKSHSVHVFDDARSLERNEDTLRVILHEDVKCKEDVLALGIQNGDIIAIDPHFEYTESGYVISRFIDDKASCSVLLTVLDYLMKNNLKPKYRTMIAFPIYEEVGHGGTYVPPEIHEYISVDLGLIGPELDADERKVSICAKDGHSPYDRELTSRLIDKAKKCNLNYCVDVFYHYGTDATAALRAGNNIYAATFGVSCLSSHGRERTHIEAMEETTKLSIAYLLDL